VETKCSSKENTEDGGTEVTEEDLEKKIASLRLVVVWWALVEGNAATN